MCCSKFSGAYSARMCDEKGLVPPSGFNFAARLKGSDRHWSNQFLLTPEPNVTYSACLMNKVAQMFETGVAPYPVERTLLVSGMLESCLTSKVQNHARLETPHLSVSYQPPKESQFPLS